MPAAGRGVSPWALENPDPDPAATVSRPAPVQCPREVDTARSQAELAGGTFADQAGALDVAAHRAQVAVAGVAHDVFVAHAFVVGLGDEADAQRVCAEPAEPAHHDPSHGDAMG